MAKAKKKTLGSTIRELRLNECMTQEQMASKLNKSVQTICCWETDKTTPCLSAIREIANLFGISVKDLTIYL